MRITHRLQFIKITVLLGIASAVLLSLNLWAGLRWFPKAPLIKSVVGLQPPWDYLQIIVFFVQLILCVLHKKKMLMCCLIIFAAYLCIEDQNRLQPWFFNYICILGVLLFYKQRVDEPNNYISVFISLQVFVALIYIYSGIQKLNPLFATETFKWIIEPLNAVFTQRQMSLFAKLGVIVPWFEILTGLGLLIKPLRFLVLPLLISMHVFILLVLGPLGKSFNYVIWPWNIVMIILCLLLFSKVKAERFFDISILFKSYAFYLVLTVMLILPFFSLTNQYDSYLSSSLYSGNTHNCKIILSDKVYNKLPLYIKSFVIKNDDYNQLAVKNWAMTELHSPCLPEYRVFYCVQQKLISLTATDTLNVKLQFIERKKIIEL